jgi:membrane-bound lytic murein transglycosylase A
VALSSLLSPVSFGAVPGWGADDQAPAFEAFRRSAIYVQSKSYKTGSLGVAFESFTQAYAEARERIHLDSRETRRFFERHFAPCRIEPEKGQGFVTGFYEPVAEAAPVREEEFRFPLYARPDDLVDLDDGNRPATLDRSLAFGSNTGKEIVEYFDRAAIEQGALAGRGLEIAWLKEPVDVFFIHVQGAARLRMTDGSTKRVTYAAKSGHPFTGPGGILAGMGEIARDKVTMQSIRAWFRDNPDRVNEILHRNRSFIFFRDAPVEDPELGPIAAAKVPLTAGRSMAVDRLLHTFGTPIFVDAPALDAFGAAPFRRLVIAQDTGSAIVGPARGDLFAGSGDAAGETAGVVRHPADFYALVPRELVPGGGR